jgi:hypothetical protein
MATRGKTVVRDGGKRGLLMGGRGAVFNQQDDCPECCCNPTDILVLTCNANRVTDDDYTVKLNGNVVGNVVHVGGWNVNGCNSPGTGIWACTAPSITAANLKNINQTLGSWWGSCQPCIQDNQWTPGTADPDWLLDSNELTLDGTSDEGCGDWGVIEVWSIDAVQKKACRLLLNGQYIGNGGAESLFTGTFYWNPLP